jgi:hypothetical protein
MKACGLVFAGCSIGLAAAKETHFPSLTLNYPDLFLFPDFLPDSLRHNFYTNKKNRIEFCAGLFCFKGQSPSAFLL